MAPSSVFTSSSVRFFLLTLLLSHGLLFHSITCHLEITATKSLLTLKVTCMWVRTRLSLGDIIHPAPDRDMDALLLPVPFPIRHDSTSLHISPLIIKGKRRDLFASLTIPIPEPLVGFFLFPEPLVGFFFLSLPQRGQH